MPAAAIQRTRLRSDDSTKLLLRSRRAPAQWACGPGGRCRTSLSNNVIRVILSYTTLDTSSKLLVHVLRYRRPVRDSLKKQHPPLQQLDS